MNCTIVDAWRVALFTDQVVSLRGAAQASARPPAADIARIHRGKRLKLSRLGLKPQTFTYTHTLFLCLVVCCANVSCQGPGVFFRSGPRNQTVTEGESVQFECVYEGSYLIPSWRINTTIYSHTELPRGFLFDDDDFSITLQYVPLSLNFTMFQCVVGTEFSSRAYLIVERNETLTLATEGVDRVTATSTSSESNTPSTTEGSTTTTVPSGDFTGSDYLSVEVTILLPVVVAVAILILVAVIFGVVFMLCFVLSKKKESVECTINTGDNEAYSLVKRYQKTIDTQANPSYEKTSVKSMSDRCRSPQA